MIHFYFKDKLINDFFYKDVFCVPAELSKKLNKKVELNFVWKDGIIENPYINNKSIIINIHKNYISMFLYFIKNIKNISILWLFHIYKHSILFSYFLKFFNKKWKIYIKWDLNKNSLNNLLNLNKKYKLLIYFLNKVDIISFENQIFYDLFMDWIKFKNKVLVLKNSLYLWNSIENNYCKKENIILVVWRIYFEELKRYTFLLKSLLNIKKSLNWWKIIFIWKTSWIINWKFLDFKKENANLINQVLDNNIDISFLWPIYERKKLYNYFNKSKIYCISSSSEGDPLVQYEAMYYSNIMVSTDTWTITENYCKEWLFISNINNQKEYENNLLKAIKLSKSKNINRIYKKINNHCLQNYTWSKNLKYLIKELKWN